MRLAEVVRAIKEKETEVNEKGQEFEKYLKRSRLEIDDLKNRRDNIINGVDPDRLAVAERILAIEMYGPIQGDDKWAIDQVINELAEREGKALATGYMGTKDYDRWSHQALGWTEYGMGPRHGSVVFRIAFKKRGNQPPLTADEIDACIYILVLLKDGKYKPLKKGE